MVDNDTFPFLCGLGYEGKKKVILEKVIHFDERL